MPAEPFPEDVKSFMDANVDSVEQLEILRVLGESPGVKFLPGELAKLVQTSPPALTSHLAALYARGLVTTAGEAPDLRWRHGARSPDLQKMLDRLLHLYRERPVTMIRMAYARADKTLVAFAEAFRLRKEG
jgi:DNA-binding transcriptional ArsR family regulator